MQDTQITRNISTALKLLQPGMTGASLDISEGTINVDADSYSGGTAAVDGVASMSNGGTCTTAVEPDQLPEEGSASAGDSAALPQGNGITGHGPLSGFSGVSLDPESTPSTFYIPAAHVKELLRQHNIDEDALLRALIGPASRLARPYISKFHVG